MRGYIFHEHVLLMLKGTSEWPDWPHKLLFTEIGNNEQMDMLVIFQQYVLHEVNLMDKLQAPNQGPLKID